MIPAQAKTSSETGRNSAILLWADFFFLFGKTGSLGIKGEVNQCDKDAFVKRGTLPKLVGMAASERQCGGNNGGKHRCSPQPVPGTALSTIDEMIPFDPHPTPWR